MVIPSFAGERKLPALLDSLARLDGNDWEAIVVLDGVVDDSPRVLREWESKLPLRVIALPSNQGRPSALNAGFAAAAGDVLIRCDDDLVLPPTFVNAHVAHHEGEPVGIVGMCPDVFDDTTAYARIYGRQADVNLRAAAYAMPAERRWRLWSANVSVTRATFDRVGEYDVAFREYGWEDIDWGYRLHKAGIPVEVPRDIEALHYGPARSVRERASKAFAAGASRRTFLAKHPEVALDSGQQTLSPWNVMVGAVATGFPRFGDSLARGADALIERTPTVVGTKVAALLVEGAGRAGTSPEGGVTRRKRRSSLVKHDETPDQ